MAIYDDNLNVTEIEKYLNLNKTKLNVNKTKAMILTTRKNCII